MTFCIVNFVMASYRNFLILVCLIAASLSGLPFSGKQVQLVVVSFTESAVIVHCVKLDVWVTPEKAGRIFYCSGCLWYSNIKPLKSKLPK